ncbi:MAG: ABC transporter substrate-binding protein, partial [Rhodospirillales bacterium]
MHRRHILAVILVAALLAVAPQTARAEVSTDEVKSFVNSMASSAINSLTGKDIAREVRKERFRTLVHDFFAIKSIGKWVLGRHWRRATPEQRDEYLQLFENMLLERYVDGFKDYSGESLEISRAEKRQENDFIVHTMLKRPGGQPVEVSWRVGVGERDGKHIFKIVDIIVNGLSMALTQQKEFNSVISNNGNSVDSLLEKM